MEKLPIIIFDPAYSGGLLTLDPTSWPLPVVFDVDGIEEQVQAVPILRDHDQSQKVGQTDAISYDNGRVVARGRLINLGIDPAAEQVYKLWKRGAELQASVSTGLIDPSDVQRLAEGEQATVNGQVFTGPIEIVRKWRLKEISVVTLGADDDGTAVRIGDAMRATVCAVIAPRRNVSGSNSNLNRGFAMSFKNNTFKRTRYKIARALFGRNAKAETATDEEIVDRLEEIVDEKDDRIARALRAFAEMQEIDVEDVTKEEKDAVIAAIAALDDEKRGGCATRARAEDEVVEKVETFEKKEDRPDEKREITFDDLVEVYVAARGYESVDEMTEEEKTFIEKAYRKYTGAEEYEKIDEETVERIDARRGRAGRSGAAAWSKTKYPAHLLGAYTSTVAGYAQGAPNAARVAEASLMTATGTQPDALKSVGYKDAEIDAAQDAANRNLTVMGLLYRTGAASYGDRDVATISNAFKNAQFQSMLGRQKGYRRAQAAGELSTVDIPDVLANVMHKSLILGLQTIDDPTDRLARVVNARDFRDQYFINLLTSGEFADVKANGELENLELSDTSYTNRAKMRGFELRLGYEAIANDDMNALTEIPRLMGRKAAIRKQKIFFDLLANATPVTGITGNPTLSLAGLDKGLAAFRGLKDGDGDPLGIRPKFLLVPPALEQTALSFVLARDIVQGETGSPTGLAIVPNASRYSGRFEAVTSEYLGSGGPFSSAWGDKRWGLIADPNDVPFIILSYYQNQRQPTLKTVYGDTTVEGLRFACWWGFGISIAEKKGAVFSNPS